MSTFIQSRAGTATTVNQTLAYASNVTAGSLLVAFIRAGADTTATPTITDTLLNTWVSAQVGGSGNRNVVLYTVSASGGANTVSLTGNNSTSSRMTIHEFGGTWGAAFDQAGTVVSGTTSPISATGVTPIAANGVMFATCGTVSDAHPFTINAGGYTLDVVSGNRAATAYLLFSSAGAYTPEWTVTGASSRVLQNISFVEVASSSTPAFGRYGVRGPIR
jgi:hypothetical protein